MFVLYYFNYDNAVGGSNPEGFIFFSSRYHLEAGGKNLEAPGFVNTLIYLFRYAHIIRIIVLNFCA